MRPVIGDAEVPGGMTMTDGAQDSLAGPEPDAVALRTATDVELLRLVRAGHDVAFAELFARHAATVRGFAVRCCTDVADAEDLAAEAFFRVLQAVRRGAGPDDNVRGYLLTVVRRLAAEWSVRRRDVPVTDEELSRQVDAGYSAPPSRADLQLISRAFATLPQRWRAVLWRVEVEGERPAVVARHFGLSANATAALARRARQGLRAAYLQAHLAPNRGANGCRSVMDKLGGFTAGQVTGAEARRIRAHLNECQHCAALQAELADVCAGLRRYAGSLTAPAAGLALGGHGLLPSGLHSALSGLRHNLLSGLVARHAARLPATFAAAGARVKLALAVVSMAAVGGFGVAAGPLVGHLHPAPFDADRGDGVGQVLLRTVPGTSGHANVPKPTTTRPATSPFDPTMRSAVSGLAAGRPHTPANAIIIIIITTPGTTAPPGQQPADTTTNPTTAAGTPQNRPKQVQAMTPATPATTTDPPRRTAGPATSQYPGETAWSTSWTSNGTTVYETVWSWSDTVY